MSDPAPHARPKRRGRGAPPAVAREVNYRHLKNPFPPIKVFSDDRMVAMHEAALDVLENHGIRVLLPDAEIGLDALAEVHPGGHFFAAQQTMSRYQTEFYQPFAADWSNFGTWSENGSIDATTRATDIWQRILHEEKGPDIDPNQKAALHDYIAKQTAKGGAEPVS